MYIKNNFCDGKKSSKQDFRIEHFEQIKIRHRDKLLSTLLQDRGALRLISAPHGFGKSVLAYEYVQRLFNMSAVIWINAQAPEFLKSIDTGQIIPSELQQKQPNLLVIDNIPYLDEERANTLADYIDLQLYKGVEVIVTTTPSHDCLRSRLPDRVLVSAQDLLVSESEYIKSANGNSRKGENHASWKKKKDFLFGLTPLSIWDSPEKAIKECLSGFFKESLPFDFLRRTFCMLLMGSGDLNKLSQIDATLRPEDEAMLIKDYPFIDVSPIQHNFSCGHFNLETLRQVIDETNLTESFTHGSFSLPEKTLSVLLEQGNSERASRILKLFCSDKQCLAWLVKEGWSLLDKGELSLLNVLFSLCSHFDLERNYGLAAIYAWSSGLQGNRVEAVHYAQHVLRNCNLKTEEAEYAEYVEEDKYAEGAKETEEAEENKTSMLMSYLALLAFGDGGAAIFRKPKFNPETLVSPQDYLAAICDEYEESELIRALHLEFNPNTNPSKFDRVPVSKERQQRIESLVTQGADHFRDNTFMRLALHFLQFIDNVELRKLLQDIGYGIVLRARHGALETNTEALIIGDLWRNGFFGLSTKGNDFKDARLLDEASSIFNRMGLYAIGRPLSVPWEEAQTTRKEEKRLKQSEQKGTIKLICNEEPPLLYVKLFGGFEVNIGNKTLSESHWRKKSRLMFVLLVLGQGRDVSREFIFEQMWPNSDRMRALDNFYSVWSNIEKALEGKTYVSRNGEFCGINHLYTKSDVSEFESLTRRLLIERGDSGLLLDIFARIEALYRGPLVPFEKKNKYIITQRAKLKSTYIDAMTSASEHALKMGDPKVSLWFARKAYEEDSTREDVFFSLIQAQIANGQRCSAIKTFFQCKEFLREELGLDPSSKTVELYDQIISVDPSLLKLTPTAFKG